jgi:hypothetical protein
VTVAVVAAGVGAVASSALLPAKSTPTAPKSVATCEPAQDDNAARANANLARDLAACTHDLDTLRNAPAPHSPAAPSPVALTAASTSRVASPHALVRQPAQWEEWGKAPPGSRPFLRPCINQPIAALAREADMSPDEERALANVFAKTRARTSAAVTPLCARFVPEGTARALDPNVCLGVIHDAAPKGNDGEYARAFQNVGQVRAGARPAAELGGDATFDGMVYALTGELDRTRADLEQAFGRDKAAQILESRAFCIH